MGTNIRQGATASFAIGDVVCPDAMKMLEQVGPDLTVTGRITMLSDRGSEKSAFAVVQVQGIHTPLIVPVTQLRANEPLNVPTVEDGSKILDKRSA
ncbi:MAG: hypothetical protein GXP29_10830 [Planctomycetes bacterium]|nr:hypothetical protein [Planctomycetota bacterium]